MANKKSKKKGQKSEVAAAATDSKVEATKAAAKKKAEKKKAKKDKKPGFFARVKKYFASVRSEMKRVTWPTKNELINFSIAVIVALIVVGVVIALIDAGLSELLAALSNLRS